MQSRKELTMKNHQDASLALQILIILLLVICLFPIFTKYMVFRLPDPSPLYDCDDAALAMLDRLTALGISATAIVGDLDKTGETYDELTHVWVIAEIAGLTIAFDQGEPWLDKQHYEGYPITRDELLEFVEFDLSE